MPILRPHLPAVLVTISALGFGWPWCSSAIGRLSGSGGADLLVAYTPYIKGMPPITVGWVGVWVPVLASCAVVLLGIHRASGIFLSTISMLIFLGFATAARFVAIGAMGVGWWLCALSSTAGVGIAVTTRGRPSPSRKERLAYFLLGTMMTIFTSSRVVANHSRRSIGSVTAEQGALQLADAALSGNSSAAVKLLDPGEFLSARVMFRSVGSRLRWLPNLRLNLTKTSDGNDSDSKRELVATAAKWATGRYVEVRVSNVAPTSLRGRVGQAVAHKIGIDTSLKVVMVRRNDRWFVSAQRTYGQTVSTIRRTVSR